MKKIYPTLFLMLAFCVPIRATDRITATLTITNAPTTNGQTITINGDTRTWYASVTNPATQLLTNSTVNGIATNLYNHLLSTPPSRVTPFMTGAAVLRLDAQTGAPLIISGVTNYFSVTYSTQTVSSAYDVVVPYTVIASATRPTISAGLVDWLNLPTAKSLFENSGSVSNLVGRTNSQTISGDKTFSGVVIVTNRAGVLVVGVMSSTNFTGIVNLLSNGLWYAGTLVNPVLTNGINRGNAFRSPGSGAGSEQFGFGAGSSGLNAVALGQSATASGSSSLAAGSGASAASDYSTAIGGSSAAGEYSVAIGQSALATFGNSVALGSGVETTETNQVLLGTSSHHVSVPGVLRGFVADGTNRFSGSIAYTRKANSSLANGNNAAVDISTNVFVQLSGPSGAFTVNGIAGGEDGRYVILLNRTGQNMTVANDSGVDPTAANRIYTLTGSDQATTADGCATLIYSAADSRWILVSLAP